MWSSFVSARFVNTHVARHVLNSQEISGNVSFSSQYSWESPSADASDHTWRKALVCWNRSMLTVLCDLSQLGSSALFTLSSPTAAPYFGAQTNYFPSLTPVTRLMAAWTCDAFLSPCLCCQPSPIRPDWHKAVLWNKINNRVFPWSGFSNHHSVALKQ